MEPKVFWGWFIALGILMVIIGGFLAILPLLGLTVMGLGILMMVVGMIAIIPILIKEMKRDDKEMHEDVKEEDLRP
ncbi:MAG: hypothetical protein ACMUHM_05845 [Thermoplasmatota archaeon]